MKKYEPVSSKVMGSALGAAVAKVLIWLVEFGVDIPESVEGGIVVIITFALGWLIPETRYFQPAPTPMREI